MLLMFFFLILFFKPFLTAEILRFTIEEKSPINTFIADLSIEFQIKTLAKYSLLELLSINKNLFSINNQTGYLITSTTNLNREEMCLKQQCSCQSCEIIFQLRIEIQQKVFTKILEIKIQDRNDHSPIFNKQLKQYNIHIKENLPLGYRIILPIANDPDEGLNSIQSYNLNGINSNDFDIDYSSIDIPYLIIRSILNHRQYLLTLIALDNNQKHSDSIQLNIHIINESIPIFLQTVYHIDIREDALIGTNLLKIEAIIDDNQKIYYEILTESPFIIDYLTGNIQLQKLLDYEEEKSYRLTIKAYGNSIPSYAIVFIHVIDINDNPVLIQIKTQGNSTLKQIRNDQNVLFIPEDTPVGTILGYVILNDLDSFVNGNPYLQLTTIEPPLPLIYKLIYQNNFQNTKIYSLILHTKLDRELKSMYKNIQLLAYDSGTPTLQTRLDLLLNITDINDCIPQILTNTTIYNLNENNPIGFIIDKLISYDCDIDLNSQYEYLILNKTDLLIINSQTGEISLNQSIDFEKLNNHQKNLSIIDLEFLIEIKDHGQPSLSSQKQITLRIHDLNDNSPQFDRNQSYNWTFSKSILQSHSILGRIFAYDNDSGLQGLINYSINSFDSCLTLDITSLGYIYLLSQPLCFHIYHRFEIIASDSHHITKQILIINIDFNEARNDFLPQMLPYTTKRTIIDINSHRNISFVFDITNNQTLQPKVYLNNIDLSTYWQVSSTGEIRLIGQPSALSFILSLNIIDEYTEKNIIHKLLQIDLCNNSCQNNEQKENEFLFYSAICLALVITFLCVFIFSIMTCLCCRKQQRNEKKFLSKNQENEDFQSEKISKISSGSIIREDDLNTNSSLLSSSIMPIRTSQCESSNSQNYQHSTYFYDIKLAELMRNDSNPPFIYVNSHSFSSDYGFPSSEASPSLTSCSSIKLNQSNIEIPVNSSLQRQMNSNSFISTCECVV